jgi:hypothetical protein
MSEVIIRFYNELAFQKQVHPESSSTAALQWASDKIERLHAALEAIANECDPADPEWSNPVEARQFIWGVTHKALANEQD